MIDQNSILSIWLRPREGVRYLQTKSHFLLIIGLTLVYYAQLVTFVLSLDPKTVNPLFSSKGLILALLVLLALGAWTFTFIQACTMVMWSVARKLKGQGTIPQTRAVVIGTLAWWMPISIFWLTVYFILRQSEIGISLRLLEIASFLGAFAVLVCGILFLMKTLSDIQGFGIWRSLATILFSSVILYGAALIIGPILKQLYQ
ncbi:MAG: hypothetical protein JSS10_01575 [Verrucomicrobia bacterium]|nr:hypothetical protein [Verrucomicrobiota bacterium]